MSRQGARHRAVDLARLAGISTQQIRNYRFSPADVRDAQMISLLRQGSYPLPKVRPILGDLRHVGSTAALRAAIADRNAKLTQQAAAMLEAASHLHGNFSRPPAPYLA